MASGKTRLFAVIAVVGSLLGLVFATNSTLDYAAHLDRHLHDVHCSFIPGAPPTSEAEACRTAMYSPYSSLLREQYWGVFRSRCSPSGLSASSRALPCTSPSPHGKAPRASVVLFALVGTTPLLVSILMFVISATQLGTFCKTCIGIYLSSLILAVGALGGLLALRGDPAEARPRGSLGLSLAWLPALAAVTLIPAVVYAGVLPDERPYLGSCGQLKVEPSAKDELVKLPASHPVRPALFFEDPLCPTCKAFHARLKGEGVLDKLDTQLALFPLDSECNWMLDSALHPGACIVARAVICGGDRSLSVLEWAYDEQEYLTRAGKAGEGVLKAAIQQRWGQNMTQCIDDPKTKARLNKQLHFAVENAIPVSTPQVYLGKQRLCDEDTDIGLRYTLKQLAPEVLK